MDVLEIIANMSSGKGVSVDEIRRLLSADSRERELIFSEARAARDRVFGKKTYLYGFVYFSTYCRNNCSFCYFRRDNEINRYRKTADEVVSLAGEIKDAGINLADLTMGEDPKMLGESCDPLVDLVSRVHDEVEIPIMVSPGAVSRDVFPRLADAGADIYAIYQETYNRDLFGRLRLGQDFDFRINQRLWAMENGILAEDGMMSGFGETLDDDADTLRHLVDSGCDQIRNMTFVPQEGTPLEKVHAEDSTLELLCIAIMRLMRHDVLIPATLDVEGINGMVSRLNAGANVVTSIIPPDKNLAGVAQSSMDIEDGHRNVDYVISILEDQMGRKPASVGDLRREFDIRKRNLPKA